jgi:hypothetical protein
MTRRICKVVRLSFLNMLNDLYSYYHPRDEGGIEYSSPYATAGRKWQPERTPRDHIQCAVVIEDYLCDTLYTRSHGRLSIPHGL